MTYTIETILDGEKITIEELDGLYLAINEIAERDRVSEANKIDALQERDFYVTNIIYLLMNKYKTSHGNACKIFASMATVVMNNENLQLMIRLILKDKETR